MKKVIKVLLSLYGVGMLAAVGCGMNEAFNRMKAEEKGMSFAEFRRWWEDTCKNAPNNIVTSAGCNFDLHPVSLRFDEATTYRIKVLAARWGITQTRVLERLVDEVWAKEGLHDDFNVANKI